MRMKFLGTGAADWFGTEGNEYRAYSSLLLDDALLIDGTIGVLDRLGDTRVTDVFYTHSHRDHFDAELLARITPVRVHAHESWASNIVVPGVTVCPFKTFDEVAVDDFTVIPLPSNHSTDEVTVHYIIKKAGLTLFYATDGAWLLNAEWHALRKESLDAAIFDATIGDGYPGDYRIFEHNSIEMLRIMVQTLRKPLSGKKEWDMLKPVLKDGAPVYLTHMARTLHPTHAEVEAQYAGEFVPAYDGMEVEL